MKKFFTLLTAIAAFISTSAMATEPEVSTFVKESFNTTFASATEVKWTVGDTYYKAEFAMNGQYASAYYDMEAGQLMATTRNISSLQLPLTLQASLKKDYSNFWVSELFEVSNDAGTSYYVTLENADNKIILKATSYNEWKTYKKVTKS
jgi:hypothetical protein